MQEALAKPICGQHTHKMMSNINIGSNLCMLSEWMNDWDESVNERLVCFERETGLWCCIVIERHMIVQLYDLNLRNVNTVEAGQNHDIGSPPPYPSLSWLLSNWPTWTNGSVAVYMLTTPIVLRPTCPTVLASAPRVPNPEYFYNPNWCLTTTWGRSPYGLIAEIH